MAHVSDVVTGILLAAEHARAVGEIFFIGEDRNYTWRETTAAIAKALKKKVVTIGVPGAIVYGVCGLAEGLGRLLRRTFPLNLDYARNFLQQNWAMDVSKAGRLLGYRPAFSLAVGAEDTARWYFQEGWMT
jgi:nucleoside-diphosphate-sugar epimerase